MNIHSLEKVSRSLESKGRTVHTDGRKTLIKLRAELGETTREPEQQRGGVSVPGHRAPTPRQLLILSHNSNRLAGADTRSASAGKKVGVRVRSLPLPWKIGFAFWGDEGFLCV